MTLINILNTIGLNKISFKPYYETPKQNLLKFKSVFENLKAWFSYIYIPKWSRRNKYKRGKTP